MEVTNTSINKLMSIKEYMKEFFINIGMICGGISIFIGALYAIRKFVRTIRPIEIIPSTIICFNGSGPETIEAVVTNRSEENLYVTECFARESKPIKRAVLTHLMNPLIKPSLYPCVWWGSKVFHLLNEKQFKLEAGETIHLKHQLNFSQPIKGFCEYEFKVIVKLSTGRTVISHRLKVPKRWHISSLRQNAEQVI